MNEPLDDLLARLCCGDEDAAARVFREFEPFLRKAIRRQIPAAYRAKFDSCDILQSVWADVLRGFREAGWRFADADQLRGFLFVATRNRLVDHIRKNRRAVDREERLGEADETHLPPSPKPRPSEFARAVETWDRIQSRCPPEHLPILRLKRQGYSLAEIARRTSLHPDSVRRVLRTIARRLALADHESSAGADD